MIVSTPQGLSGQLDYVGYYAFNYAPGALPSAALCLGMPVCIAPYEGREPMPIFQMNLPEGQVLQMLQQRFGKTTGLDPMQLLELTAGEAGIGRVSLKGPDFIYGEALGVDLSQVLADQGTSNLFHELADTYLIRSSVSGMQPKLLVPEQTSSLFGKASAPTQELIVKTEGPHFPGLAINEFLCMSIAKEAGIPVPEFYLSADGKRFVTRRFDRTQAGASVGFEDIAALAGLNAKAKYTLSYEQIAVVLTLYCSLEQRRTALAQLFDQVALSVLVGNGDAHLKNFGVIYEDPAKAVVKMSPAYDIVCTTCYVPNDVLALTLNSKKSLTAAMVDLEAFGKNVCKIVDPLGRIARLVHATHVVMSAHSHLIDRVPGLRQCFESALARFEKLLARHPASLPSS
ncbi:TPA: HipA domain-containing protein [Stenotrophomonas maltophilia]|nr:HipA domain-containing protein [Stenotrophomonas maltophilia]